tara:strand:+ start:632 stop:940 length:309 start_codon:yes stop_codon:yes gene_type:complete
MKKTMKQKILENDLSMEGIMTEFNSYKTGAEKAKFLREMGQLNLPYDVKWERLAQGYDGTKPFPVYDKKEKDEDILKDTFEEVSTSAGDDKPLTHEELEALI